MSAGTIVLAAGGTGGHLFPAQALAAALAARGRAVAWITDERGRTFGGFGAAPVHVVSAATPTGRNVIGRVAALGDIAWGALQARALLARLKAGAVVGFGGYPSLPPLLAAGLRRLPTAIHEQNAVLGRVNRKMAPRVDRIATSFPDTVHVRAADAAKVVLTGNPVRPAVAAVAGLGYDAPGADGPVRLLVFGGSQGAQIMAARLPLAVGLLPPALRQRLQVVQQARAEDVERVRGAYAGTGITAEVAAFFDDLPARMAAAHLVVARSGASTVAELVAIGRPGVLMPYPHAVDDHQTANAKHLERAGAAWTMADAEASPERLAERLTALLARPATLAQAAAAAAGLGDANAAARLADMVEALAPTNGKPVQGERRQAA
jgi:UDP-N-acetylglucosamine--N-acetylmuramyl-(pentapeptide) pyrophosphoryl-undecaprenol N-acetylglucosamine transferase